MMTMSLSGCIGGDDTTEEQDDQNPTTGGELDDWNVHFVATSGDLPACDAATLGRLYYVEDDGNFQVCKTLGWEVIDISGADGSAAAAGADGKTPMFNVTASTTCLNGGKRVAIGEDIDENGVLDAAEAIIVMDICDGESGADGVDGNDGADGTNGIDGANALISTSEEPAGSNCANGGTRIDAGVDDDGDGTLDAAEIDQTQYVCDGGSSNNTLLSTISLPPPSMGCDAGGIVISFGLDNGDGGGIYANGVLEAGEVDTTTTYCSKYIIGMVKDINPGSITSSPTYLTAIGNTLYFTADDSTNGAELWKSDGTTAGTGIVKDIYPGTFDSDIQYLIAVGNTLYFRANDGTNGNELWKSDGTTAGTVMVKDIPGSNGSSPSSLIVIGNTLYFSAGDGTNGHELWSAELKSDGSGVATAHEITYS
jgi:ELWxxDGT repeat protein